MIEQEMPFLKVKDVKQVLFVTLEIRVISVHSSFMTVLHVQAVWNANQKCVQNL